MEWESREMSNEKVKSLITGSHSLSLKPTRMNNSKIKVSFRRSCLKQVKKTLIQEI